MLLALIVPISLLNIGSALVFCKKIVCLQTRINTPQNTTVAVKHFLNHDGVVACEKFKPKSQEMFFVRNSVWIFNHVSWLQAT